MFNFNNLIYSLRINRNLPGINLNVEEQLDQLSKFAYNEELLLFPEEKTKNMEFYYHNAHYESGDAEFLYNMIRYCKPIKIVEIGSGYSTLMAINAIRKNREENINYICEHICIEPYEKPWLEKLDVEVIRSRVELVDKDKFLELNKNDILFIDSSHIIRPQGDLLFEYLEILPILHSGVLVHFHDIFIPKDYPDKWIIEEVKLWNEQYLLEAFLTANKEYKVIGALNYLKNNHFENLSLKCPILMKELEREPGSFWIRKI